MALSGRTEMKDAIFRELTGRAMPIILACGFVLLIHPCSAQVGEGIGAVTHSISRIPTQIFHVSGVNSHRSQERKSRNGEGRQSIREDRSDEAIPHLQSLDSDRSGYVAARNNLAVFIFKMGKTEFAIAQLEEAVTVGTPTTQLCSRIYPLGF